MITTDEIFKSEVRAISIKQPFAQLMLHGKQETRTWNTPYRGLVLICASVNPFADTEIKDIAGADQYARILQLLGVKWFNQVKRGNAIAIGRLVNSYSYPINCSKKLSAATEALTFVQAKPGLFIHTYKDVTAIKTFPWKGKLNWTTLTEDQKKLITIL